MGDYRVLRRAVFVSSACPTLPASVVSYRRRHCSTPFYRNNDAVVGRHRACIRISIAVQMIRRQSRQSARHRVAVKHTDKLYVCHRARGPQRRQTDSVSLLLVMQLAKPSVVWNRKKL